MEMAGTSLAITRMQSLLEQWEVLSDLRSVFLSCYAMMTRNMLSSINGGNFHDPVWVSRLLEHFAGYYFTALDSHAVDTASCPAVWKVTFAAAQNNSTRAVQHLLLGVNAHINYDLVLALCDMLEPEWAQLPFEERAQRYEDHCQINWIIAETIDEVQDRVLERYSPELDLMDKVFGRIDEWLISGLITRWRDQVWSYAMQWVESQSPEERGNLIRQVEDTSLRRGDFILLKWGSLPELD
jgi:Family of unknown function (DUF5995)